MMSDSNEASVQSIVRRSWMTAFVAFLCGCSGVPRAQPERAWPSKTKAKLLDGTPIEICVYDEPLNDDGFVINVHRTDDPPGKCWGVVIYPKPVV